MLFQARSGATSCRVSIVSAAWSLVAPAPVAYDVVGPSRLRGSTVLMMCLKGTQGTTEKPLIKLRKAAVAQG